MRLVTALASKGNTLSETLTAMTLGPAGRPSMLQTLTTRDVVMIPDLFEASTGKYLRHLRSLVIYGRFLTECSFVILQGS